MELEYPGNFSRFYDFIYHSIRDGVDNRFYLEEIRKTDGKILEIGTGTGRLFVEALRSGADMYGIDISRHMLEILLGKLDQEHHYRISLQNIINFSFDFKFDLIIAPFRVLMHVFDKDDQLASFNNIYRHLNSGGTFIFDVFVPDLEKLIRGMDGQVDFSGEYEPGRKLTRTVSTDPDIFNQLIRVHFRLDWEEEKGSMTENWDIALRYFFRFELEHLMERSNFKDFRIYGSFEYEELSGDSMEYVVVCHMT
jgi:SAM-dependent methyltransferase